jgi:hypothetical protein
MACLAARIRVPLLALVILVLLVQPWWGFRLPWWAGCLALLAALTVYAWIGRVDTEPVPVSLPVHGRWRAVNSPSSRVPSHGIHTFGQTYAIDLVFDPASPGRRRPSWRPLTRRAGDFPGFGQPVHAAAAGRVVRVRQRQRDHWSRTSVPGLVYLLVEGMIREVLGAGRVVGNHIVVDIGDHRYAMYAHLQRNSAVVRPGEHVTAGQLIARCGNSGNSSEPHLHFQLMDHPAPSFAAGLPFNFATRTGTVAAPQNGELLAVSAEEAGDAVCDRTPPLHRTADDAILRRSVD